MRADFNENDLAELQCALIDEFVVFDLRGLESEPDDYTYEVRTQNSTGTMITTFTFQYCDYTKLSDPKTFAYMDQHFLYNDGTESDNKRTILTDDKHRPDSYEAIIDSSAKKATGVETIHNSATSCTSTENY